MLKLYEKPFCLSEEEVKWVEQEKKILTTDQKIGQLFCVMGGDYSMQELTEMVREKGVGAVLYRPEPCASIQEKFSVLDEAAPVPLLHAANLEEGSAGGISDGTYFGWPMAAGATDNPDIVRKFARSTAVEGRRAGIDWTFSPVSDLTINFLNPITAVRSYGSDKDRVCRFTRIFTEEVQKCGVAACAKHFPGDGVDFRDHHLHPTYNSLSADEWYDSYGKIYQNLIDGGILSFMVGHIVQPEVEMRKNPKLKFEDCLPGSLSRELMTDVLREEFGFNGVITTDATIMGGYCMSMERKKAIPQTIMAGADMIVFNTDFTEDYGYMKQAYENGSLTPERLDEAVTRILALKAVVRRQYILPQIDSQAWQKECAEQAVTLVKNRQKILPVKPEQFPKIRLILLGTDEIRDGKISDIASKYLQQCGFETEIYDPYRDDLHGSSGLPQDQVNLYLANYETASNQTTVRINWCPKHALDSPRFVNEEKYIFISFGNPFLLMDIPRVKTYINAYSATRALIEAALDKVIGKDEFRGTSPVDAFCGLPDTRL